MRFDYNDKTEKRVAQPSPYALDYPKDVEQAPDKPGVYMFLDILGSEVLYVGRASGGNLKEEIKSKAGTPAEKDARKYRWFRTDSEDAAKGLEEDWIKKYQPKNNQTVVKEPTTQQS